MDRQILPIGTVLEIKNGIKVVIIGYELEGKLKYSCGSYPSFLIMDLIPLKKFKTYREKYGPLENETTIDYDSEFRIVHLGYQNQKFYEMQKKI